MKRTIVLGLCLFALSACYKQKPKKYTKIRDALHLQESIARFSDIPDVPLHAHVKTVVKSDEHPHNIQIFCRVKGDISQEELKSFYIEEMERLGWHLDAEYEGIEILLYFVKPDDRICIISIRNKSEFVITLCKKKEML